MITVRSAGPRRLGPGTPAELVKRGGRVVLWALVVVLLLRGVAGVMVRATSPHAVAVARPAAAAWPDEQARAFAADFARAYLTYSPGEASERARSLAGFVTPELAGSIAPEPDEHARPQVVTGVTVARTKSLDARRALITVAVYVPAGTRYLTVPVARDGGGGLVVDELPSFSAPPRRATVPAAAGEPLPGTEQDAVTAVVSRFLRSYLAGDATGLEYLVPPGVRIATPAPGSFALVDVDSIVLVSSASGRARTISVGVRVRDLGAGVVLQQRYRMRLELRERWYVAAVNGSREG